MSNKYNIEKEKRGGKSISISKEVYARLEAEKGEGESFNAVLNRLTEKKSLLNIVGFLKVEEAEEMEKIIKEMREKSRARYAVLHYYRRGTSFNKKRWRKRKE